MTTTFSPSLKLALIGTGDQSGVWGSTTNTNLGTLLEQAITGVTAISLTGLLSYTLTNFNGVSDDARNQTLVFNGSPSGTVTIVAPLQNKWYIIANLTSQSLTISATGGSISLTIPPNVTAQCYCDASNVGGSGAGFYSATTGSAGNFTVNGTLSATGVTDTGSLSVGGNLTATAGTVSLGSGSITGTFTAPTQSAGDNSTKLATTAFVANSTSAISGQILMWPTASAPSGYLLCNGNAVSRTTYAGLYSVIGTTFGTGDGTTTFNLPNYQDRFPIGSGTIASSIGATGGSKDAVVVSHTHSISDPGHAHTIQVNNSGTSYGGGPVIPGSGQTYSTDTAFTGISVNTAGVSGTNANLPPYLGINFIIKT